MKDVDVKKIIGEVAARHGVLIEENDPLMVALIANGLVLEVPAWELMALSRALGRRKRLGRHWLRQLSCPPKVYE